MQFFLLFLLVLKMISADCPNEYRDIYCNQATNRNKFSITENLPAVIHLHIPRTAYGPIIPQTWVNRLKTDIPAYFTPVINFKVFEQRRPYKFDRPVFLSDYCFHELNNGKCEPNCLSFYNPFDGGDCDGVDEPSFFRRNNRDDNPPLVCPDSWLKNGICDVICNTPQYDYDNGACCKGAATRGLKGWCIDPRSKYKNFYPISEVYKVFPPRSIQDTFHVVIANIPWYLNGHSLLFPPQSLTENGRTALINPIRDYYNLKRTILHELGHLLGLLHTFENLQSFLTFPFFSCEGSICDDTYFDQCQECNSYIGLLGDNNGDFCHDTTPKSSHYAPICEGAGSGRCFSESQGQSNTKAERTMNLMDYAISCDGQDNKLTDCQKQRMTCFLKHNLGRYIRQPRTIQLSGRREMQDYFEEQSNINSETVALIGRAEERRRGRGEEGGNSSVIKRKQKPSSRAAPAGWTCDESFYDTSDGCDCDCGIIDPDCYGADQPVFGCNQAAMGWCDPQTGMCGYGIDLPPEDIVVIPSTWICPLDFYGTDDGCDCECGAMDPDCEDESAPVFNCQPNAQCIDNGVCSLARDASGFDVPDDWTCPDVWYGGNDGCDCACGAYDLDCDNSEDSLLATFCSPEEEEEGIFSPRLLCSDDGIECNFNSPKYLLQRTKLEEDEACDSKHFPKELEHREEGDVFTWVPEDFDENFIFFQGSFEETEGGGVGVTIFGENEEEEYSCTGIKSGRSFSLFCGLSADVVCAVDYEANDDDSDSDDGDDSAGSSLEPTLLLFLLFVLLF